MGGFAIVLTTALFCRNQIKMFTATRTQAATYLLGVCLFAISFLVFLNSSVSFVITDILHQQHDGIGDAVGTLGFADELLALFACPFWGLLSDRIGCATVCLACKSWDLRSLYQSRLPRWGMASWGFRYSFSCKPPMSILSFCSRDLSLLLGELLRRPWSRPSCRP